MDDDSIDVMSHHDISFALSFCSAFNIFAFRSRRDCRPSTRQGKTMQMQLPVLASLTETHQAFKVQPPVVGVAKLIIGDATIISTRHQIAAHTDKEKPRIL
jgi:hypothetical protein